MSDVTLTVDLGNSRCKLRLWRASEGRPEPLARRDLEVTAELSAAVGALLAQGPRPDRVALSSVASTEITAALAGALSDALGGIRASVPDSGLENGTEHPGEVGSDRLFAARGAIECVGRSAIVVDCGTALTVDAVRWEPGMERPRFLGGAIAPGATLAGEALARAAARLPVVAPEAVVPETGVPALGRSTAGAIRAGLTHGLRGAARELAETIAAEAGFNGSPVLVTGGGRSLLLAPPFSARAIEEPELVHAGLWAAARDAPPARDTGGPWGHR